MTGRTPLVLALSMAGALALYGCSGGGDGPAPTPTPPPAPTPPPDPPPPPPPPPPPDPLKPSAGLSQGDAEPVYARSTADKLRTLIQNPATIFAPLAVNRDHDYSDDRKTAISTEFRVKSVRGDGAGGYHVVYVIRDDEATVHIAASDYDASRGYYTTQEDADGTWFTLWTGNIGRKYLQHADLHVNNADGRNHNGRFVFGARTPADAMPSGSGAYVGDFYADSRRANNPTNQLRQRITGTVRLAANFDMGTLSGAMTNIRGAPSGGSNSDRVSWPTSGFTLSDGRIVDGQFTATLAGTESDPNADPEKSLVGFMGAVLGEFYGPNAEEVAGVFNATRDLDGDDNDRVLSGELRADSLSLPALTDTAPVVAGVDRTGYSSPSPVVSAHGPGSGVAAIARDGAGGYQVTYMVEGVQKTVRLSPDDFNTRFTNAYWKREGENSYYLGGMFGVVPDYDHLNVNVWAYGEHLDATSEDLESVTFEFAVNGQRTGAANMPAAGSAAYAGTADLRSWNPSPGEGKASSFNAERYRGDLNLTADFAAGAVTGRIDGLSNVDGAFAIGNGRIEGDALSADLSGLGYTGTVRGAFYGPGAAEVGGVVEGTGNDRLLQGWFAGRKQ